MSTLVLLVQARLHAVLGRLDDDGGQTSAEYALVLLGAATIALLVAVWAKDSNKVGQLLDAVFGNIVKLVK